MDKSNESSEPQRNGSKEYSSNPIITKLQKVLDTRIENDEVTRKNMINLLLFLFLLLKFSLFFFGVDILTLIFSSTPT